jgi:hypothetical protein
LDAINLDSDLVEARNPMSLVLNNSDTEVGPVPAERAGGMVEPELDYRSAMKNSDKQNARMESEQHFKWIGNSKDK